MLQKPLRLGRATSLSVYIGGSCLYVGQIQSNIHRAGEAGCCITLQIQQ
jgi:hypothetical protein